MTSEDPPSDSAMMLPEQRVGMAMREARELRGISLRQMAKRLNYHSHTTLSSYERGAVMPTEEAVQGYEQVLRLERGVLMTVLEGARVERHGDAWAKRRVHLPAEFVREEPILSNRGQATQQYRQLRGRWVVIAGAVAVVLLVTLGGIGLALRHPKAAHRSPAVPVSVRDGSDPKVTGCATGAITVDSLDVYDPPQHLVGVLELRSSARCGASWGRFTPTSALSTKPLLRLEIDVYRPADGAAAKFKVTYDGLAAYGNMLVSRHECVYAELTLLRRGKIAQPPVQTRCVKSPDG
jgi:transcriptional regulator with XRE-family HTH domain